MPRLLRGIFRKRRQLLLDLSRCAAEALTEYMRRHLGAHSRPGIVVSINTSGDTPAPGRLAIRGPQNLRRFAQPLVRQKMAWVLDAYPQMKGLQAKNDEGVDLDHRASARGAEVPWSPPQTAAELNWLE
jgi:hypothetical protein